MAPRLLDFLNKPKYKILFYIYRFGGIDTCNSRSNIARAFEYSSDGHFYTDFDDLLKQKLIIEEKDLYKLGKEGRRELLFFFAIEFGLYISLVFTLITLYYTYMLIRGIGMPTISWAFMASYQLLTAYLFYKTRKIFTPTLPKSTSSLKNRGLFKKIMTFFSR